MATSTKALVGKQVLLVEDNFLVALDLQMMLQKLGCEVVGPLAALEQGLRAAERDPLNLAVLDINLAVGTSIPIALALQRRSCPFLFVTGYANPRQLPPEMEEVPRLVKPVDQGQLGQALIGILAGGEAGGERSGPE